MRIAVDVDGVLADRVPVILELIKHRYGETLDINEITDWDSTVPLTGNRLLDFFAETDTDPQHIASLPPVCGAVAGMQSLNVDHELVIATYRLKTAREPTISWLEDHNIPFDSYPEDITEGKTNVTADVLIEDSPYTGESYARYGGDVILLEQPWNTGKVESSDISLAQNWSGILDIIDEYPE